MVRLEDLEPKPLSTKVYLLGNLATAAIFLAALALFSTTNSPAGVVLLLAYPVLVLAMFFALFLLPMWRQRALAFLGWALVWVPVTGFLMSFMASKS